MGTIRLSTVAALLVLFAIAGSGGCADTGRGSDSGVLGDLTARQFDISHAKDMTVVDLRPGDLAMADLMPTDDAPASLDGPQPDIAVATDGRVPDLFMVQDLTMPKDGPALVDAQPDLVSRDLATSDGALDGAVADAAAADGAAPDLAMVAPVTFMVVRVGDGQAALTSAAQAVFIEKKKLDGTAVGNPIALPIAANGNTRAFTLSGTSTSEGYLSHSDTGSCVVLGGYDAAPGTAAVSGTPAAANNRILARVDAMGAVDTSTRLSTAYDAGNIRGATTSDCTSLWSAGTATSTGGVWYIPFGTTGGTQVLSMSPSNTRVVHVIGGQLYVDSGTNLFTTVLAVGMGTPKMAGQTAAALPGLVTTGASPYSFALFDRDAMVAGLDTLYIADDRIPASSGGIQKWKYDGMNWKLVTTFVGGLTTGERGLTGVVTGKNLTLIATTTETMSNTIVTIVDDGANMNPNATVIATAPANEVYRGVALSP